MKLKREMSDSGDTWCVLEPEDGNEDDIVYDMLMSTMIGEGYTCTLKTEEKYATSIVLRFNAIWVKCNDKGEGCENRFLKVTCEIEKKNRYTMVVRSHEDPLEYTLRAVISRNGMKLQVCHCGIPIHTQS